MSDAHTSATSTQAHPRCALAASPQLSDVLPGSPIQPRCRGAPPSALGCAFLSAPPAALHPRPASETTPAGQPPLTAPSALLSGPPLVPRVNIGTVPLTVSFFERWMTVTLQNPRALGQP